VRTLVLLVAFTLPGLALAQAPAQPPAAATGATAPNTAVESSRALDGHVFTPSPLVASPFPATSFRLSLLYGSGTAVGPTYDIDGNVTGERNYTYAAWGQTFGYEQRLWDWLSLDLGLITNLYTGLDTPSALVIGAEVGVGAWLGAHVGHRVGPVQLGGSFQAIWAPRIGILVADAIISAIDSGSLEGVSAFSEQNGVTLVPAISAAWAPWRPLGITASLEYQWISQELAEGTTQTASAIGGGLALDFDFGKLSPVDVALVVAYHVTDPLSASSDASAFQTASLGLHYTGRTDLDLGLDLAWRKFSIRPESRYDLDSNGGIVEIGVQYFW
jgi:hypothetical protein